MPPASWTRAPVLAWLMAHAYGRHRWIAVLAYPVALGVTLMHGLLGSVYASDDGHGMVIVARQRPAREAVVGLGIVVVGYGFLALAAVLLSSVEPVLGPAVVLVLTTCTAVGAFVLVRGQLVGGPAEDAVPASGHRWQVAALAQRPGTRLSAMMLTRRVIDTVVPAGDVLVAVAGDDRLERAYVRAGFTAVGRRRLYRVV